MYPCSCIHNNWKEATYLDSQADPKSNTISTEWGGGGGIGYRTSVTTQGVNDVHLNALFINFTSCSTQL